MANSLKSAQFLMDSRLAGAAHGSAEACFELGVAYSGGSEAGQSMRAEIAEEMTAREIAEAQRQARAWIVATEVRAA